MKNEKKKTQHKNKIILKCAGNAHGTHARIVHLSGLSSISSFAINLRFSTIKFPLLLILSGQNVQATRIQTRLQTRFFRVSKHSVSKRQRNLAKDSFLFLSMFIPEFVFAISIAGVVYSTPVPPEGTMSLFPDKGPRSSSINTFSDLLAEDHSLDGLLPRTVSPDDTKSPYLDSDWLRDVTDDKFNFLPPIDDFDDSPPNLYEEEGVQINQLDDLYFDYEEGDVL
jgi:hypothetical protein